MDVMIFFYMEYFRPAIRADFRQSLEKSNFAGEL